VDGAGQVLLVVLVTGKDLDQLRPIGDETLHVAPDDGLGRD